MRTAEIRYIVDVLLEAFAQTSLSPHNCTWHWNRLIGKVGEVGVMNGLGYTAELDSNEVVLLRYSTKVEVFTFYFYLSRFLSYFLLFVAKSRLFSDNVGLVISSARLLQYAESTLKYLKKIFYR